MGLLQRQAVLRQAGKDNPSLLCTKAQAGAQLRLQATQHPLPHIRNFSALLWHKIVSAPSLHTFESLKRETAMYHPGPKPAPVRFLPTRAPSTPEKSTLPRLALDPARTILRRHQLPSDSIVMGASHGQDLGWLYLLLALLSWGSRRTLILRSYLLPIETFSPRVGRQANKIQEAAYLQGPRSS